MKQIIERHLPLNVKYILTDKKYIPLINGTGCCCDNCGKLIANIATVKNENKQSYNIGFDCLETLLINNALLSSNDIAEYERVKKMIPKVLNFSKKIKEAISKYPNITGLLFGKQWDEFFTFYWLCNNATDSKNNDSVKIKDMEMDFLIETLKNIFPKLTIITNLTK